MIKLNIQSEALEKREQAKSAQSEKETKTTLQAKLAELSREELEEKFQDLQNKYLYLLADFENYKRNVEKERSQMIEQGKELVLKDVFKILELMDRALASARERNIEPAVLEGLELVRKEINRILEKYNVERIPSVGEKFNPELHEAIGVQESAEVESGTIIYEHEPGFKRQGKVLQPARVVVAK